MSSTPLWRFGQCFGEKDADEEFSEADVLSAVEFDTTGNYLATGDKGGRIVVFERAGAPKVRKCGPLPWLLCARCDGFRKAVMCLWRYEWCGARNPVVSRAFRLVSCRRLADPSLRP